MGLYGGDAFGGYVADKGLRDSLILSSYSDGMTIKEIALKTQLSNSRVSQILRNAGVQVRKPKKEKDPYPIKRVDYDTPLPANIDNCIEVDYKDGMSVMRLASKYNKKVDEINMILDRLSI